MGTPNGELYRTVFYTRLKFVCVGAIWDNYLESRWCPIFKAIVAGFRGKVALKNRTLGVPGMISLPC